MRRAGNIKRSVGWAVVVAATGGGLLMATPSSAERSPRHGLTESRTSASSKAMQRALGHAALARSERPSAQRAGGSTGAEGGARRHREDPLAGAAPEREEPGLEPWSLLAVGLSVMVFIARRRRAD